MKTFIQSVILAALMCVAPSIGVADATIAATQFDADLDQADQCVSMADIPGTDGDAIEMARPFRHDFDVSAAGTGVSTAIDVTYLRDMALQTSGTFTATLQIEASADGTNYVQVGSNITTATITQITNARYYLMRVRTSAYTSGTPDADLIAIHDADMESVPVRLSMSSGEIVGWGPDATAAYEWSGADVCGPNIE